MRAIIGLTAGYMLLLALAFFVLHGGHLTEKIVGSVTSSLVFGFPVLIAFGLATLSKRDDVRRALLIFEIIFLLFTTYIFYQTFSSEHDAQYQLALLLIPLVGFIAMALVSIIIIATFLRERLKGRPNT